MGASSWGGLVGMHCIVSKGLRPTRTLLLAPALTVNTPCSCLWPNVDTEALPDELCRSMTIVHGTGDILVPIKASRNLKERFPNLAYLELAGGDHRLNKALGVKIDEVAGAKIGAAKGSE